MDFVTQVFEMVEMITIFFSESMELAIILWWIPPNPFVGVEMITTKKMRVELVTLKKVKCDLFHSYKKMSVTNSTPTIIMCDLFHFHKKLVWLILP